MPNPFVHVELSTGDVDAAKTFYKAIFGWKLGSMPMGEGQVYTTIDVGGGTGGGMMMKPAPDMPTMWMPYVLVDDVKKTVERARKAGAQIVVDYNAVGDMGAFAILIDPTGAALGLWQTFMKAPVKKPAAKKTAKKKAPARKKAAAKKNPPKKK